MSEPIKVPVGMPVFAAAQCVPASWLVKMPAPVAASILLANGMSAARTGDIESAVKSRDGLKDLTMKMEADANGRKQVEISWLETAAVLAQAEDRHTDALNLMNEAVRIAERWCRRPDLQESLRRIHR